MGKHKKNISCPACKKKYSDMDAAWNVRAATLPVVL